ncbi:MAG TPA: HAD family hydrolase [Bacteroidales bacterium]|nr:HAD family hydrolase [Bacteroidales bacterium]
MIRTLEIDSSWSLFLDRDGVINRRIPDDYVKNPEDFEFLPGVEEAIAFLAEKFRYIVVVTNQQGIGRGLMTTSQLEAVHRKMMDDLQEVGGRIDKVYFSPDLKNSKSFTRKPAVGMGLRARKELTGLRFRDSIMVGDTGSDMLFGKRLGMTTVLITQDIYEIRKCSELADFSFPDLISFARALFMRNGSGE